MALLPIALQQLFGENATQTETTLIINKNDLFGLIPSSNNTAESLLAAIALKADYLFEGIVSDENGNLLSDENGDLIGYDYREIYELLSMFIWEPKFVLKSQTELYKKDTIIAQSYTNLQDWE